MPRWAGPDVQSSKHQHRDEAIFSDTPTRRSPQRTGKASGGPAAGRTPARRPRRRPQPRSRTGPAHGRTSDDSDGAVSAQHFTPKPHFISAAHGRSPSGRCRPHPANANTDPREPPLRSCSRLDPPRNGSHDRSPRHTECHRHTGPRCSTADCLWSAPRAGLSWWTLHCCPQDFGVTGGGVQSGVGGGGGGAAPPPKKKCHMRPGRCYRLCCCGQQAIGTRPSLQLQGLPFH